MISVEIDDTSLLVEGHAGSGPYGHDLVCAAASILVYTALANLEEHEAARSEVEPGRAWICVRGDREAAQVLRIVGKGFELLAEQRPEHICVKKVGA